MPTRQTSTSPVDLPTTAGDAERCVAAVEAHLQALGEALRMNDGDAITREAQSLHRSLAHAIRCFSSVRHVDLPMELRRRLALAGGQVAAQRESLARATAALDRAIDVLLPGRHAGTPASLYAANGLADRSGSTGGVEA